MRKLRIARGGYTAISMIFYLAAALYLFFPLIPPLACCWFGGVTLIAYGVIKIIGYFSEDLFCLAFRYDFSFGLLLLAAGALLLIRHTAAFRWLPVGIGWLALLDGALKLQMSEEARRFGLERWDVISAAAMVTSVLGVALIIRGAAGPGVSRLLPALVLVSAGAMNRCVIKFTVKQAGNSSP